MGKIQFLFQTVEINKTKNISSILCNISYYKRALENKSSYIFADKFFQAFSVL